MHSAVSSRKPQDSCPEQGQAVNLWLKNRRRKETEEQPDAGGRDFMQALNPHSLRVVQAVAEPSLAAAQPEQHFQFERLGYFVADRREHRAGEKLVFNRITGLRDTKGK